MVSFARLFLLPVLHISHQDAVNHRQTNNYKQSVPEQRFAWGLGHAWGIPAASSKLEEADCPGFSEKKPTRRSFDARRVFPLSLFRIRAQLRQWQERRSRQLPALPVITHRYLYTMRILFEPVSYPQKKPSSALPVARASLKPATHTPCDDSQVSCYSETFVPANQSSILFRATPLRQQRLNDSERKEKRSECAFPCAFSRECGMQLSCDVRFRVFLACATHFAPRRSKPHTDKQLQTKRARTEVCAGPGTWGIPAVLCSCVCGMQLSCGVRFRIFVACATHFVVRRSKPQTDKQRQTTQVVVRRSKPQTDKQRQTKRASAEVCAGAGTRGIPAASSKLEEADCPGFFSEKKPKVGRAVATENSSAISLLPPLAY